MAVQYEVRGPCTVVFGAWSFNTTEAGVIIRPREIWKPISADLYGKMPAALIHVGKSAEVEFVALDVSAFDTDLWLGGLRDDALGTVGTLVRNASIGTAALTVTETTTNAVKLFTAPVAFPLSPAQLFLSSVQEMRIPMVFRCLRDTDGAVFSTVPSDYGPPIV